MSRGNFIKIEKDSLNCPFYLLKNYFIYTASPVISVGIL
nr:MAG TPA: hypothetical protein [Caudoviricetes sp.]DAP25889.1 MAG TPA: hypothetical protein [Caudoviricetes sp.]